MGQADKCVCHKETRKEKNDEQIKVLWERTHVLVYSEVSDCLKGDTSCYCHQVVAHGEMLDDSKLVCSRRGLRKTS